MNLHLYSQHYLSMPPPFHHKEITVQFVWCITKLPKVEHGSAMTGEGRTGQDRTGQDRTGQDRTGQDRTGQDKAGQNRTGQVRIGQVRTGQARRGQDKIGQERCVYGCVCIEMDELVYVGRGESESDVVMST